MANGRQDNFPYGSLDESIYMVQPEVSIAKDQEKKVCKPQSLFIDSNRHLGLGISNLTNRSSHLDLSNVLMNLVCIRGVVET